MTGRSQIEVSLSVQINTSAREGLLSLLRLVAD